ncbi:bifunctional DNA primase/polymerase [Saccharopolyspora mangrovi]|uniref:Bifunctional DNA primase/polymerase n=1 Tax=Saccharopolyspora mangrovi TaxID=3082379 RepID=A0ABU6A984_9PSEU|nr:bifunctional DNA primase/polymerase [Saccharopolyspora sp. S2-29]MEB3368059.1 bifunctional DNA primase/polymerase [Saccharopolyspora sp. S2-29]
MTTNRASSAAEQLRDGALLLAKRGWKVFPLRPGTKRSPALHGRKDCPGKGVCSGGHRGWEQRATSDASRVWACWSTAAFNIAIATGPSGLLVVDCDQPKTGWVWPGSWNRRGVSCGLDVLAVLAEQAGATVPATYTVATPSGGRHFYFRAPADLALRNTSGVLGPLIDTRAGGGYVVAPGSVTSEGVYELVDDAEPVDLPGWLVQRLARRPAAAVSVPREIPAMRASRYVAAAVRNECERLAATGTGAQNQALFTAALALGRLVAGGAVDEATVREALHHAMSRLPLTRPNEPWTPAQIDATITSGFRYAATNPRTLRVQGGDAA